MGKAVKVGGNIFKNLKFDTKDPSMWLNGVIILLIVVVFILLAVQIFTPRKDVIDGFHTIPITNRNLPWPFNDAKFDPLYYSLVFAGKTKNGSAHGEGKIFFSVSQMPVNQDNLPLSVKNTRGGRITYGNVIAAIEDYKKELTPAAPVAVDTLKTDLDNIIAKAEAENWDYNQGKTPESGLGRDNWTLDENAIYQNTDGDRPDLGKGRLGEKQVKGNKIVQMSSIPSGQLLAFKQLLVLAGPFKSREKSGKEGTGKPSDNYFRFYTRNGNDFDADAKSQPELNGALIKLNTTKNHKHISVNLLKKYMDIVKKVSVTDASVKKIDGLHEDTADGKKLRATAIENMRALQKKIKDGSNYQDFIEKDRKQVDDAGDKTNINQFELFTGSWNEGKLTKATIRDCGGENNFTIFYNDKEQVDDEDSVLVAMQWLRTPMFASCMGN